MLPKYLLKNLCQANIQSGRGFCVLFLCQRPDRSDHAGGIDFYLLQRHCAAVDALQQVVIITLVARHDPVGICAARCGFCGGGSRPGQPRIPAHIGKMRLCAKRENRGGRPPFCGGTTPNNLSVNSEKVLAGWAAIRQINLPAGKESNMSAPFCSFTKGREKEYNLNNRHRKYTVRQDRNAQYQLMQGDCHIWRVSCIGSRNGDLP